MEKLLGEFLEGDDLAHSAIFGDLAEDHGQIAEALVDPLLLYTLRAVFGESRHNYSLRWLIVAIEISVDEVRDPTPTEGEYLYVEKEEVLHANPSACPAGSLASSAISGDGVFWDEGVLAPKMSEGSEAWAIPLIAAFLHLSTQDRIRALNLISSLFRSDNVNSGYGGKPWAVIVDVITDYYRSGNPTVFIDRLWNLQHNCDSFFDKEFYDGPHGVRLLEDLYALLEEKGKTNPKFSRDPFKDLVDISKIYLPTGLPSISIPRKVQL